MNSGKEYEKETQRGKAIGKLLIEFMEFDPVHCDMHEGDPYCVFCDGEFGFATENKHEESCLWLRVKKECADIAFDGIRKKL